MKLIIKEGATQNERTFDLDEVRIGRSGKNDIVLKDPKASRYHCRLIHRNGNYSMIDIGSQNGTLVNGLQVLRQSLSPGDAIRVGDTEIYFESLPPALEPGTEIRTSNHQETLVRQLTRERSNLLRLQEVNRAINSEMNIAPLLERIIDSVIELSNAERGFLIVVKDDEMEFEAARNFKETEVDRPDLAISRSIATEVIKGRRPLIVINAKEDDRFRTVQSIANLGLLSVLCVPLVLKGEVVGALYVDNRLDKGVFEEEDLSVLESFADQAAIAIHNARQIEELRGKNAELARTKSETERMNLRLNRTLRSQRTEFKKVQARLGATGRRAGINYQFAGIVGCSRAMTEIFSTLERVIDSDYPVLINGESGTGKELIASAIHSNSARADKPFVTENCAALPDTLLESELFGHVRGAFTGAVSNRKGLLELADQGTLFLDEVGDMSTEMQKKLLRFLQESEFRPVGGATPIRVDVRILSASNSNLREMVQEGRFREDLFYRLNVLPIRLPPLRERDEDIPLLIDHFLTLFCEECGVDKKEVDPKVIENLSSYSWPGNVRELENEIRRLVTFSNEVITLDLVSPTISAAKREGLHLGAFRNMNLNERVEAMEKHEILRAMDQARGNKSRAARQLGISRFTLQRKIDKYGMQNEQ